ncbi:MAG TPA: hypothetical protein VGS27_01460 [Candidatus Sulfotelmatobacter sp.]|nr:hypothetical protein [Candidatus Sulfotelmatobacter sp.]
MRSLFGLTVASAIILFLGYTGYMHFQHATDSVELQVGKNVKDQARQAETAYEEPQDAKDSVAVAGPLAAFMAHKGGSDSDSIETIEYKPTASDHVGDSVVGTTNKILHQTFAVAGMVDLPFEVPAHAYNPQFHGTFRSFSQAGGKPTTSPGDVDFLLLNDQQYSALVAGHPDDAIFSADATHDQEVNANLPPTLSDSVKYHLIFRNVSPKLGKKVVQAEFQIDF